MIRILCALKVGQVATDAGGVGRGQFIVSIHMALLALQGDVRAGQGKARRGVIERGVGP